MSGILSPQAPQSDFQEIEIIESSTFPAHKLDALKLNVPLWLPERRIYLYLEALQSSTAAFRLDADVLPMRGGRVVGRFPANIATFGSPYPGQSVATVFNAGGSPVGDSVSLILTNPFVAGTTSVVIQPFRINAEIESLVLAIRRFEGATVTGWRAYLACLSTKY